MGVPRTFTGFGTIRDAFSEKSEIFRVIQMGMAQEDIGNLGLLLERELRRGRSHIHGNRIPDQETASVKRREGTTRT